MLALREALALRQTLAAGQTLTPEQAAALRLATSAAARTGPARTASGRPAAKRTPTRKPAARTAPARAKRARTKADRPKTPRTGARWSTRLKVVALSTVLLPAVASLVLPAGQDAAPGGGPLDVTALALTAQSSLLESAGEYRRLEQEAAARSTELRQAHEAQAAALAQVAADQQVVGRTAAGLYRAAPDERYPLLGVTVHDGAATSAALYRQALAERSAQALEGVVVRAERAATTLAAAAGRVAAAQTAVDAVTREAAAVLTTVRETVGDLGTDVTSTLAGLGAIPSPGPQQERNTAATARWQAYLGQLAAAGIEPPSAADLTDAGDLPSGLSPALDAAGAPVPGIAWAVIGSSPVTVLPAETVAAVSAALSQLGKPYVPGTSGPETYDCGGFTAAAWLLAGYAVPTTPQDQWATGTPVPLTDLQIGDLVFAPGGQDVGIYLGEGDVLGASAGSYQVGVGTLAAGSSATRVTLPAPAQPNAALPPGGTTGACGAALPVPGTVSPAWGGWANGQIPTETLCALGVHRHALRCDAAASYAELDTAYRAAFGSPLCITDSYRSLGAQIAAFYRKPGAGRGPRHVQPRMGAGGRPLRRHQHRRVRAVDLDDGQRRSLRVRAADLGGPGRREARALALGVRLHLLTRAGFRYRKPGGGQIQGRSASDRQGSVTLASVVSPASRAAIPGPAHATGRCGVTTTCMSGRYRPAASIRSSIRSGATSAAVASTGTAAWAHSATGPSTRRSIGTSWARPVAAERVRCIPARTRAGRRRPGQRQLPPADDDAPAHGVLRAVAPVQDGDPRRRRGGIGHRAVRHPGRERRGDAGARRGHARAGHVVGELVEVHAHAALVLLQDDDRPRARALHHVQPEFRRRQDREDGGGDLAEVRDADPGRAQPLQQPGRRSPEAVVHQASPPPSSARSAPGRVGSSSTLVSSAALSRTGSTSWPQPVARRTRAADAGQTASRAAATCSSVRTSSRWKAASGCTRRPSRASRTAPASWSRSAALSQCGTRTSGPGAPAGRAVTGGPGNRRTRRAALLRAPRLPRSGGCTGGASRGGYRQRRTPMDPSGQKLPDGTRPVGVTQRSSRLQTGVTRVDQVP